TNAVRYARPGVPPVIHIRSERDGDVIRLSVSDNGQGIDLESVGDRLFQLHETFHNHPDSKGVGLYLVHRMVTASGGKIEVESKPGEGTSFRITLPAGGR
ncbi:MAG: ATP-binding protein, partial [Balneolaceae bacterium]